MGTDEGGSEEGEQTDRQTDRQFPDSALSIVSDVRRMLGDGCAAPWSPPPCPGCFPPLRRKKLGSAAGGTVPLPYGTYNGGRLEAGWCGRGLKQEVQNQMVLS